MSANLGPFFILEAIHSCALEHVDDCKCVTCRAAHGDRDALAEVYAALAASRLPERSGE